MLDSPHSDTSSLDTLFLDPLPPETRTRLMRFSLTSQDSMLLPLEELVQILSVDVADILPIPEMPNWTIGICNWRGEMLWLIDLSQFVGYPSLFDQAHPKSFTVLIVQINEQTIGVAVTHVNDIELHDLQQLQPSPIGFFPPHLLPLVRGIVPGCSDAVLDLQALTQCPQWQQDTKEAA